MFSPPTIDKDAPGYWLKWSQNFQLEEVYIKSTLEKKLQEHLSSSLDFANVSLSEKRGIPSS